MRTLTTLTTLFALTIGAGAAAQEGLETGKMWFSSVGVGAYRWFALPIERKELRNLKRWYDALTERPGYQEHIMNPME